MLLLCLLLCVLCPGRAFSSLWFRSALISSEDTSGNTPGSDSSSNSSSTAAGSGGSGEAGGSSSSSVSSAAPKAPRQQLRFVFVLPPVDQQEELEPLLVSAWGMCVFVLGGGEGVTWLQLCTGHVLKRACTSVCVQTCLQEID